MESSPAWKPLLSGHLQTRALETAEAIARDLAAARLGREPGLIDGYAGYALFFEAAARSIAPHLLEQAALSLQRAAVLFSRMARPARGLHGGLAGLGWVAMHLAARHPGLDIEELCGTVDAALEQELEQTPWRHPCDIRDGLAGMGLYAAKRAARGHGSTLLKRMVAKTEALAEVSDAGSTWSMPSAYWKIYAAEDATFARGLYTMGTAHGIPGALALLGVAHAHGIDRERTGPLLEKGFQWVAARAEPGHPQFPHYFHGTERVTDKRFSWCVGNPGIAAALWWTARLWGHPDWEARTLEWSLHVAEEALERSPASSSANLCCGTAGTAQLFLRLAHATQRPVFAEAATQWIEHTLALRQPGQGPGGYCFEQDPDRPVGNIQFGAAGIALMLLAAATDQAPDWDEPFLFSLGLPPFMPAGN